jgi:hypothetical protein
MMFMELPYRSMLNLDLWVLYGVCAEIRFVTCVDVLHGHVRLLDPVCGNR